MPMTLRQYIALAAEIVGGTPGVYIHGRPMIGLPKWKGVQTRFDFPDAVYPEAETWEESLDRPMTPGVDDAGGAVFTILTTIPDDTLAGADLRYKVRQHAWPLIVALEALRAGDESLAREIAGLEIDSGVLIDQLSNDLAVGRVKQARKLLVKHGLLPKEVKHDH